MPKFNFKNIKVAGGVINKELKGKYLKNLNEFEQKGSLSSRLDYAWEVLNSNKPSYSKPIKGTIFTPKEQAKTYLEQTFGTKFMNEIAELMTLKAQNPDKNYIPKLSDLQSATAGFQAKVSGNSGSDLNVSTQTTPDLKEKAAKTVAEKFKEGKVADVVDAFKHLNNEATEYLPEMGPLPKSSYTYDFENIVRKLMNGKD